LLNAREQLSDRERSSWKLVPSWLPDIRRLRAAVSSGFQLMGLKSSSHPEMDCRRWKGRYDCGLEIILAGTTPAPPVFRRAHPTRIKGCLGMNSQPP